MRLHFKNLFVILGILAAMLFASESAAAQERLRNGVAVRGEIGGEAHQRYVIRARRGQTLTITINRRVARDGNFNLSVARNADFYNMREVNYGRETSTRTRLVWAGKVRANGNYYIYLTAYPTTNYTIRATVR